MLIGERIRELRKSRNLTQKQLGELSGIAEPTIRRYELGKLHPKIETLERIAAALDVHVMKLLNHDDASFNRSVEQIILFALKENYSSSDGFYKDFINGKISLAILDSDLDRRLFAAFYSLSEEGQNKAVAHIEELADIPKYKKPPQD